MSEYALPIAVIVLAVAAHIFFKLTDRYYLSRQEPLLFQDLTEERVNEVWATCLPVWRADSELRWPQPDPDPYDVERQGL